MALNGYIPSINGGAYSSAYIYYIQWSAQPDIANNRYTITAQWVMKKVAKDNYGSYNNYPNQACVAISIAGLSSGNIYNTFDLRSAAIGSTLILGEFVRTVPCNDDGSLSVNINGSHYTGINWGTKTTSATVQLDTIPRASVPSVSGTLELGQTITINSNRKSSNFVHNLYYSWGSEIVNQRFATGVGASTTWTIPKDLANHIMYGVTGTLFITCETYNGSQKIGDKTISVTVSVPDTAEFNPSISEIALSEAVSGIFATFGAYIQNQSKAYCTITAKGAYSSQIISYKAVVNGATYNNWAFTTDFLKLAGTNSVVVTVTDTRGRTATLTRDFEVMAYEGPTITKLLANRCDLDGTLNEEGEYTKLEIAAILKSLNNKNTYSYILQYKKADETSYSQYAIEMTETKTETDININGTFIIETDGNYAFDFIFSVADVFISNNKVTDIETAFCLINWNPSGKGLAFGKVSKKNALEINMDIYDKYEQLISNGLAEYRTNYVDIDPNTTLSHLILTETNTPEGGFYYIMTFFFADKKVTSNRTQIAIPYIYSLSESKTKIYIRQSVGGEWNNWSQI